MGDDNGPATGSYGALKWAIQTAGFAGFVGLAAIQYFAHADPHIPEAHAPAARLAQAGTARGASDPETTGSIAKGARTVRLDPCGLQAGGLSSSPRAPRP